MEIGNLFKPKEPETPAEKFLAIQIQEGILKTAVWQVINGHPEIINFGTVEKWIDTESLVTATDTSLSSALESQTSEPDQVIFGLPDSWIKEDKINPEYGHHLKELIAKLELKPIGFVAIIEATIQQLKNREGIPPSAIFLEIHSTKVNVVVVKLGETVGKEEVGRSDDLAKDVQEGLARLNINQLPARIIIIDGQEPDVEQQLTSFPWQDDLSFLHLPKVELPDPNFSIEAVALSGGSEAAKSLGIEIVDPELTKQPSPPENTEEQPDFSSDNNLGFITGQDIRKVNHPQNIPENDPEPIFSSSSPQPTTSPKLSLASFLSKIKKSKPIFARPTSPFAQSRPSKKLLLLIPTVFILLLVGSIFAYSRISTATITIFVSTKELNKSIKIAIADTPQDSIPTLSATAESLELQASGSIPTSGEALVGEKATGELTFYNLTSTEKKINAGTSLITGNNRKFTLNENITIASASSETNADLQTITTPGKSTGKATASAIGADSNVDKETELTVGTYPKSSLLAKANTQFSGGTSRTVKAVSKKDQQTLLEQLSSQISEQAHEKLESSSDYQIISQDTKTIKQKFSHDIGEEADTLSLDLEAKANFLRFQQSNLQGLIESQLKSETEAGFSLSLDKDSLSVETPTNDSKGLITTIVTVKAKLIPEIAVDDYRRQLKGKSVETARQLLENIAGYQKLKVVINPKLPFLSNRLPANPDKIILNIEPSS